MTTTPDQLTERLEDLAKELRAPFVYVDEKTYEQTIASQQPDFEPTIHIPFSNIAALARAVIAYRAELARMRLNRISDSGRQINIDGDLMKGLGL